MDTAAQKACRRCGEVKDLADFYVDQAASDGRYSSCKACHRASVRRYQRALDPRTRRIQQVMATYFVSAEVATRLVDATTCEICGVESDALEIDHCHETGRVRGALCGPCNRGIARFDKDPAWLIKATAYVWPVSGAECSTG